MKTKPQPAPAIRERVFRQVQLSLRAAKVDGQEPLPAGVCGRINGIALVYNVADDYGTVFVPGCLAKTRAERVAGGKVKLFADHGPFTDTHVGVVRSLEDVGDAAVMTADLFDTEAGRAMKEYLDAVLTSGADTGLSIGFRPIDRQWMDAPDGMLGDGIKKGDMLLFYKEIELREISITPVPAVPGTDVVSVRREAGETDEGLLRRHLGHILRSLPERDARAVFDEVYATSAASTDTSAAPESPTPAPASTAPDAVRAESAPDAASIATSEQRIAAARQSYARSA
jgi:HK97 family phage prohead protease